MKGKSSSNGVEWKREMQCVNESRDVEEGHKRNI